MLVKIGEVASFACYVTEREQATQAQRRKSLICQTAIEVPSSPVFGTRPHRSQTQPDPTRIALNEVSNFDPIPAETFGNPTQQGQNLGPDLIRPDRSGCDLSTAICGYAYSIKVVYMAKICI